MIEYDNDIIEMLSARSGLEIIDILRLCAKKDRLYLSPAVDDQSKISYFRTAPETLNHPQHGEFRQKNAIMVKPGKLYRYLFPDAPDSEVKAFAEAYRRQFPPESSVEIKLLSGASLLWAYDEENYKQPANNSPLWESCMRHDECQDYLHFYNMIGCSLLTALQDEEVVGRAVVWPNAIVGTTKGVFLDRIFAYNDIIGEKMLRYAEKSGWITREDPFDSQIPIVFYRNGETIGSRISVDCPFEPDEGMEWPYLDTLRFLNFSGQLSNDSSDKLAEASSTDGSIDMDDMVRDVDGNWLNLDHPEVIEVRLPNGQWEYNVKSLCVWSKTYDEYILEEDAWHAEDIDDYVFQKELFQDVNGDDCYKENARFSNLHGGFLSEENSDTCYDPEFGWYDKALVEWVSYQDLMTKETLEVPSYNGMVYTQASDREDANNLVLYNEEFYHIDGLPEKVVCEAYRIII
jgi:hypothetical protein